MAWGVHQHVGPGEAGVKAFEVGGVHVSVEIEIADQATLTADRFETVGGPAADDAIFPRNSFLAERVEAAQAHIGTQARPIRGIRAGALVQAVLNAVAITILESLTVVGNTIVIAVGITLVGNAVDVAVGRGTALNITSVRHAVLIAVSGIGEAAKGVQDGRQVEDGDHVVRNVGEDVHLFTGWCRRGVSKGIDDRNRVGDDLHTPVRRRPRPP